jgi:poly(3-hydroxybutyrate) depolymerase
MKTGLLCAGTLAATLMSSANFGCSSSGGGVPGRGGSTSPSAGATGGASVTFVDAASGAGGVVGTGGALAGAGGGAGRVGTGGRSGGAVVSGAGGSAGISGTPGGHSGGSAASGGDQGGTVAVGGAQGGVSSGGRSGSGGQAGGVTGAGEGGLSGLAGRSGSGGLAGAAAGGTTGGGRTGGATGLGGQTASGQRPISFGTLLDPQAVVAAAQQLAKSLGNPSSAQWQAKGDQHRTYRFAEAGADEPYRLCVPTNWDGKAKLPLVMFLHGSGSDENAYVDQNNKQMVSLAQQHGFLLVAPLGASGAYGNFLRLTSPFGDEAAAAKLMSQVTADSERTNELSEKDVINVLELVLNEYPIDRAAMFLTGHSMGSGGTWYIGGKYATYWKGLAPMSGPFVQESGYPWDSLRTTPIFVTEGTQAPSLDASRVLRDWLKKNGFSAEYEEVNADHPGMVRLVLPDVFDFFDRSRSI